MNSIKEETILVVDSVDFSKEVEELLGVPEWECGYIDEMNNGSYMELSPDWILECDVVYNYDPETKVTTERPTVEYIDDWIARFKSPDYNEYKERDKQPGIATMFYYLYVKGHLPLGNYLVKVWW